MTNHTLPRISTAAAKIIVRLRPSSRSSGPVSTVVMMETTRYTAWMMVAAPVLPITYVA